MYGQVAMIGLPLSNNRENIPTLDLMGRAVPAHSGAKSFGVQTTSYIPLK
jgi:hypothetical protein